MSDDFSTKIKKDEQYRRYKKILATVKEALDLTKTGKQASFIHSERTARKLFEVRVSPQKLFDAVMQEVSCRSRLVELKTLVIDQKDLLEGAITMCRKHLKGTYAQELAELSSTIAGRNEVLDRIFASGKEYLSEVASLNSKLDLFIKDIDAAGYSITNGRELLKMILDKKESV